MAEKDSKPQIKKNFSCVMITPPSNQEGQIYPLFTYNRNLIYLSEILNEANIKISRVKVKEAWLLPLKNLAEELNNPSEKYSDYLLDEDEPGNNFKKKKYGYSHIREEIKDYATRTLMGGQLVSTKLLHEKWKHHNLVNAKINRWFREARFKLHCEGYTIKQIKKGTYQLHN